MRAQQQSTNRDVNWQWPLCGDGWHGKVPGRRCEPSSGNSSNSPSRGRSSCTSSRSRLGRQQRQRRMQCATSAAFAQADACCCIHPAIPPSPWPLSSLALAAGAQLLASLENGVSEWPKHEGRFPQACAGAAAPRRAPAQVLRACARCAARPACSPPLRTPWNPLEASVPQTPPLLLPRMCRYLACASPSTQPAPLGSEWWKAAGKWAAPRCSWVSGLARAALVVLGTLWLRRAGGRSRQGQSILRPRGPSFFCCALAVEAEYSLETKKYLAEGRDGERTRGGRRRAGHYGVRTGAVVVGGAPPLCGALPRRPPPPPPPPHTHTHTHTTHTHTNHHTHPHTHNPPPHTHTHHTLTTTPPPPPPPGSALPGYDVLAGAPLLCDVDCTPLLAQVIANHFLLLRTMNRYVRGGLQAQNRCLHFESVIWA